MPDNTRDLVIQLGARFEDMEKRVAKNSQMLEDLHHAYLRAEGAGKTAKMLLGGGKLLFAGASGAGLWTWASAHLPRF